CFTHLVSGGHNLIGNATNCTISGVTTGNKTGNPGLAPLGNYGGPTQTHALLPGSQAIDAGDPAGCTGYNGILTTDQRGAPRAFDGDGNGSAICDMGAFENYDFDGDGYLDSQEVAIGENPNAFCPIMRADVNMDGVVSILDFVLEAASFGQVVPPAPARKD